MNTATLTFTDRDTAKDFTSRWSCHTLTGHNTSATHEDGSVVVKVYNVGDEEKAFIDAYIAGLAVRSYKGEL